MLSLTPALHPLVKRTIENKEWVGSLVRAMGSPLNVVFPTVVHDNLQGFNDVYKKHNLRGKIFYAHKPNKSKAFVRQLSVENACIEVASENELKSALSNGFTANRIEATGPKNESFLWLCLQHAILINVDNFDELSDILALQKKLPAHQATPVLVRLNGFRSEGIKLRLKESRFGISLAEIDKVFTFFNDHKDSFDLKGFAFHLDTASLREKVVAIENVLQVLQRATEYGLKPTILNIGGGYRANYLHSEEEWNTYIAALQQSVLGNAESMSWQDGGLGYRSEQGVLRGVPQFYESYVKVAGPDYLETLLNTKLDSFDGATISALISDYMLELYIEPGRALLSQAGITIGRVSFIKETSHGQTLIGLDMNYTNLHSHEQELLVDPIIVASGEVLEKERGVYFVGNLCLESDILYRHKTFIKHMPTKGDLVIFPNTAAYNMDFGSSMPLQQRAGDKIAVSEEMGKIVWSKDEEYFPNK